MVYEKVFVNRTVREEFKPDEYLELLDCFYWARFECPKYGGSECSVFKWSCWNRMQEMLGLSGLVPSEVEEEHGFVANIGLDPGLPVEAGMTIFVVPFGPKGKVYYKWAGAATVYAHHKFIGHRYIHDSVERAYYKLFEEIDENVERTLNLFDRIWDEIGDIYRGKVLDDKKLTEIGKIVLDEFPEAKGIIHVSGAIPLADIEEVRRFQERVAREANNFDDIVRRLVRHAGLTGELPAGRTPVRVARVSVTAFVSDVKSALSDVMGLIDVEAGRFYSKVTGSRPPMVIGFYDNALEKLSEYAHYLENLRIARPVLERVLRNSRLFVRGVKALTWAARIAAWVDDFLTATRVVRHVMMMADGPLPIVDLAVLALDIADLIIHRKEFAKDIARLWKETQQNLRPLILSASKYLDDLADDLEKLFLNVFK